MSENLRIALPTNIDFGLAEVALLDDPADYPVAAAIMPGRSDDELRHAAEDGNWDLYTTHGIDQEPLTFSALRWRFKDGYNEPYVDEPGGFIKAVLKMQRTLPTATEYARTLALRGLIRPDEAVDLPDQFDYELLNTDEGAARARAHLKVAYLANAIVPDLRTADLAAQYASNRIQSASKDQKAQLRADELLYQARGIGDDDLPAIIDHLSPGMMPGRVDGLRRLGLSNEQISQIDDAPRPDVLYPRYKSAESIINSALGSWSLDRLVAYRQFYGVQNLVDLATTHAAVEKPFDDRSLAFSSYSVGMHLAGSHMVHSTLEADAPFVSAFLDKEVAPRLGIVEQMAKLGVLAMFMMREPALNGPQDHIYPRSDILGHNVTNMVTTDYRIWLDQRLAQERRDGLA